MDLAGLVLKAHRLLHHSTLGSTVIKMTKDRKCVVILVDLAREALRADNPLEADGVSQDGRVERPVPVRARNLMRRHRSIFFSSDIGHTS